MTRWRVDVPTCPLCWVPLGFKITTHRLTIPQVLSTCQWLLLALLLFPSPPNLQISIDLVYVFNKANANEIPPHFPKHFTIFLVLGVRVSFASTYHMNNMKCENILMTTLSRASSAPTNLGVLHLCFWPRRTSHYTWEDYHKLNAISLEPLAAPSHIHSQGLLVLLQDV